MARRFGRNQRRHMREEIATKNEMLSEALNRSRERKLEADELRSRLHRWAEDVAQLMGPDSAFNEQVRRMAVEDVRSFGGRLRLNPVDLTRIVPRSAPVPMTSVETIISALIWRLHLSRDEFRPMIRVELENRYAEPVGYALAEEHRWTERDVRYLAERIAREMTDLLNAGVDKRRKRV